MLKNLELDLLRCFLAVNESGGFNAAGKKIGRTQAAVSQQIRRLEEILEKPLFERTTRKVKLTAYGEVLLSYAKKMLDINDETLLRIRDAAVSGTLRLGAPEALTSTHLPRILSLFSRSHPNVTLDVTCGLTDELLGRYEKGEYDVVIFKRGGRIQDQGTLVFSEKLSWMKGAGARIMEKGSLPLILSPDPCVYRRRTVETLAKVNRSWHCIMTLHSLSGRISAVKEGLGVSLLPTELADDELEILPVARNLPNPGKIDIAMISSQTHPESIAGQFYLHALEYFRK